MAINIWTKENSKGNCYRHNCINSNKAPKILIKNYIAEYQLIFSFFYIIISYNDVQLFYLTNNLYITLLFGKQMSISKVDMGFINFSYKVYFNRNIKSRFIFCYPKSIYNQSYIFNLVGNIRFISTYDKFNYCNCIFIIKHTLNTTTNKSNSKIFFLLFSLELYININTISKQKNLLIINSIILDGTKLGNSKQNIFYFPFKFWNNTIPGYFLIIKIYIFIFKIIINV